MIWQRTIAVAQRTHFRVPVARGRAAFTLVEMLVAMALSLIVILAVTQVFRIVGDNVLAGRAVLEMSGQLRSVADQLQRDLEGLTVPVRPWPESSSGQGYFEIYEGPFWDLGLGSVSAGRSFTQTGVGDMDDVLLFTTHTTGTPFVGQVMASLDTSDPSNVRLIYNPGSRITVESRVAEVAWFSRWNDWNRNGQPDPGEITLHRRVFLVLPNLDLSHPSIQALSPLQFYSAFDLSVRTTQTSPNTWIRTANSLKDLTQRENRIAHDVSGAYPSRLTPSRFLPDPIWRASPLWRGLLVPQGSVITPGADGEWGVANVDDNGDGVRSNIGDAGQFGSDDLSLPLDSQQARNLNLMPPADAVIFAETFGSDTILSNLLAFDVKVYDPTVAVRQAVSGSGGTELVLPGDPGYDLTNNVVATGGYVDLFFNRYLSGPIISVFAGAPLERSGLGLLSWAPAVWGFSAPFSSSATYDTWTSFYEYDGIDQDGNGVVDQGTDGIDNNDAGGVDDATERETAPPYAVPLRGIQVRIRGIDPDTRQVRQVTVMSDFVPE